MDRRRFTTRTAALLATAVAPALARGQIQMDSQPPQAPNPDYAKLRQQTTDQLAMKSAQKDSLQVMQQKLQLQVRNFNTYEATTWPGEMPALMQKQSVDEQASKASEQGGKDNRARGVGMSDQQRAVQLIMANPVLQKKKDDDERQRVGAAEQMQKANDRIVLLAKHKSDQDKTNQAAEQSQKLDGQIRKLDVDVRTLDEEIRKLDAANKGRGGALDDRRWQREQDARRLAALRRVAKLLA
jgi:hypothetical protein